MATTPEAMENFNNKNPINNLFPFLSFYVYDRDIDGIEKIYNGIKDNS